MNASAKIVDGPACCIVVGSNWRPGLLVSVDQFSSGFSRLKYRGTIAPDAATGHSGVMKRTVVWLTNDQVKALTAMSKKSLAPVSALVRQAVKDFLRDKRKRPA